MAVTSHGAMINCRVELLHTIGRVGYSTDIIQYSPADMHCRLCGSVGAHTNDVEKNETMETFRPAVETYAV